jgi:hypothetical protein
MGMAYPAWKLTPEWISTLETYASVCRTHDDLAIGAALQKHAIGIVKLEGYGSAPTPYSFMDSADENALWAMDLLKDKDVECASAISAIE